MTIIFLNWFMSSRSTNDSGREFNKFIVEGKKEFKYVSVLAKRITTLAASPGVDVEGEVKVNETSRRPCNIL